MNNIIFIFVGTVIFLLGYVFGARRMSKIIHNKFFDATYGSKNPKRYLKPHEIFKILYGKN